MDINLKNNILGALARVFTKVEFSRLLPEVLRKVKSDLEMLASYFQTTKEGALLIAIVYNLGYYESKVSLKRILEYLNCPPARLLEYSDVLHALYQKGIFVTQKTLWDDPHIGLHANAQFAVHRIVAKAILQGLSLPKLHPNPQQEPNIIVFMERIYRLIRQREERTISNSEVLTYVWEIVTANKHLSLFQEIVNQNLNQADTAIYISLMWETAIGTETIDIFEIICDIYDFRHKQIEYAEELLNGSNRLLSSGLIEIVEFRAINDIDVQLSIKTLDLMKENDIHILTQKNKKRTVIYPDQIVSRCLIYNEEVKHQLTLIKGLLRDKQMKRTQERLATSGLPKGITILLHGPPGTGKTETVKQLARETGREIVMVNISEAKSLWYGESEKITKRIFTEYKSYAKNRTHLPILLFNEADAILSRRKDTHQLGIDQTENTVQNIILEELENFDGILIMTTNLVNNLDSAYERRFLFKIKFEKPDQIAKATIWKSKLPELNETQCFILAEHFDFSGGEIDNIVRKHLVHETLYGASELYFEKILEYCRQEKLSNKTISIGFKKSPKTLNYGQTRRIDTVHPHHPETQKTPGKL